MGRLVNPMSREEFDKLPRWQKFISNNALWVIPLFLLVFGGGLFALARYFDK